MAEGMDILVNSLLSSLFLQWLYCSPVSIRSWTTWAFQSCRITVGLGSLGLYRQCNMRQVMSPFIHNCSCQHPCWATVYLKSQKHRMGEVGSDLWRSPRASCPGSGLHGFWWSPHNFSGQPMPVLGHPHSRQAFCYVQTEHLLCLHPLLLVLPVNTTEKSLAQTLLQYAFRCFPWAFSFLG